MQVTLSNLNAGDELGGLLIAFEIYSQHIERRLSSLQRVATLMRKTRHGLADHGESFGTQQPLFTGAAFCDVADGGHDVRTEPVCICHVRQMDFDGKLPAIAASRKTFAGE